MVSVAKGSGNPFGGSVGKHHSIVNSVGVSGRGNALSGVRDVASGPMSLPVPPLVSHVPFIYGGPPIGKAVN